MADVDLAQFRNLFIQTSKEYLDKLEKGVSILQQNPEENNMISDLYISSHSLKSQCLLMGYHSLGETAFSLEKLFRHAKEAGVVLSSETLMTISTSVKAMQDSLQGITKGDMEEDLSSYCLRLNLILEAQ